MSNTMTAAHESPISYLDNILKEEDKRCEYGHQWRNFTISRSGRFRSKNKKRDVVDGKLFDGNQNVESEKISGRNVPNNKSYQTTSNATATTTLTSPTSTAVAGAGTARSQRDKVESYKSFYETNL
ncbi:uncharacterized protein LOC115621290 [Scaptodrosophila lebanonensis]|uniref:Uncharacterized protein LOC115621290 n=1 Tax=Drosophila lebanonensis TaxID=7225 RepID=A0A6J2T739_DROLE|nr:uncharacterized protein LOC115621290 [Scaptodrosophila lebanonensis]